MTTNSVYLKKSGLYIQNKKKYQKINKPIAYYLHYAPVIQKGFTISYLMEILKEHEKEIDMLFMPYTRGFNLAPFYEEMQQPVKEKSKKDDDIVSIEYSWGTSIDNTKEFGKPNYQISEYVHLSGLTLNKKEPHYSLLFIPMNEIKDATLKLNSTITYEHIDCGEIWEKNRTPKEQIFFKGEREFVLEDIIGGFLNEITYTGYPEDRIKRAEELKRETKNSKKQKLIPWEKIQLNWALKDLREWNKKKDSKMKSLKIERLKKTIKFLREKMARK